MKTSGLLKKGVKGVTAGELNKEKKDVCAQISLKINKHHTDSKCSDSGSDSSPEQTWASRSASENKSHNTKHESALMEESSFQ